MEVTNIQLHQSSIHFVQSVRGADSAMIKKKMKHGISNLVALQKIIQLFPQRVLAFMSKQTISMIRNNATHLSLNSWCPTVSLLLETRLREFMLTKESSNALPFRQGNVVLHRFLQDLKYRPHTADMHVKPDS